MISYLYSIEGSLARQNRYSVFAFCLLLVLVIGFLDFITGFEITFFIFYAIPIWLSTWCAGRKAGLLFAVISIISWTIADIYAGHIYSHALIPYWNGLLRFIFFLFSAFALDSMKIRLELEERNADIDGLTGLLNGRAFRERAEIMLPLIRRERQQYALAFIDVDNFKTVNDTKGHAFGDEILRKIGNILSCTLRESDLVSRMGGDEFVIFLTKTRIDQAETILSQLKEKLDETALAAAWPIGFSIGSGVFSSEKTGIEEAIRQADALMYEVKKRGKGEVLCKDLTG